VFFYPRWTIDPSRLGDYAYTAAALALLGALYAWRRRIGREPLAACLFFAAMLVPVLGFVNFYFMIYSFVSDHYQYLASFGVIALFAGVAATAAAKSPKPRLVQAVLATTLAVLLGMRTTLQALDYRDEETLWRATLDRNPAAWMAATNLGWLLAERGEEDEALRRFDEARIANPRATLAWIDGGIVEARFGRLEDAARDYRRALELEPDNAQAHNLLGVTLALLGSEDEAADHFRAALRVEPDSTIVRANLERSRSGGWADVAARLRSQSRVPQRER
jgi:Flp pilus assembly protein TadD